VSTPVILLPLGSLRRGSTNEAVLRTAQAAATYPDACGQVLGYTGAAVIESACVGIPVDRGTVGTDGLIIDPGIREQLGEVLELLTEPKGRSPRSTSSRLAVEHDIEETGKAGIEVFAAQGEIVPAP
jgi:hypothetical protein